MAKQEPWFDLESIPAKPENSFTFTDESREFVTDHQGNVLPLEVAMFGRYIWDSPGQLNRLEHGSGPPVFDIQKRP